MRSPRVASPFSHDVDVALSWPPCKPEAWNWLAAQVRLLQKRTSLIEQRLSLVQPVPMDVPASSCSVCTPPVLWRSTPCLSARSFVVASDATLPEAFPDEAPQGIAALSACPLQAASDPAGPEVFPEHITILARPSFDGSPGVLRQEIQPKPCTGGYAESSSVNMAATTDPGRDVQAPSDTWPSAPLEHFGLSSTPLYDDDFLSDLQMHTQASIPIPASGELRACAVPANPAESCDVFTVAGNVGTLPFPQERVISAPPGRWGDTMPDDVGPLSGQLLETTAASQDLPSDALSTSMHGSISDTSCCGTGADAPQRGLLRDLILQGLVHPGDHLEFFGSNSLRLHGGRGDVYSSSFVLVESVSLASLQVRDGSAHPRRDRSGRCVFGTLDSWYMDHCFAVYKS